VSLYTSFFATKIIDLVASFTIEWKYGLVIWKFQSKNAGLDGAPSVLKRTSLKKEKILTLNNLA
jgi:hypothetical protein